jgi:hypothetical protein
LSRSTTDPDRELGIVLEQVIRDYPFTLAMHAEHELLDTTCMMR